MLIATYGLLVGNTKYKYIGNGIIHGYKLSLYNHLTVEQVYDSYHESVHVAVFDVDDIDEFDNIEGAPVYYERVHVFIQMDNGDVLPGQVYVMNEKYKKPSSHSQAYYEDTCVAGYKMRSLSTKQFFFLFHPIKVLHNETNE